MSRATLHIIALNNIGGVETSFTDLFRNESINNTTQLCLASVSPNSPYSEIKLNPRCYTSEQSNLLAIPVRLSQLMAIRRRFTVESLVFWNHIPGKFWFNLLRVVFPKSTYVYYERGKGWLIKHSTSRQRVMNAMHYCVTNSTAAEIILRQRWKVTSNIYVVRNPIPRSRRGVSTHARSKPRTQVIFGIAARLVAVKAVHTAIEFVHFSLQQGLDCKLVIAGGGPLLQSLTKHAKSLGLSESVDLLGAIDDMDSFYSGIDILLVTSLREPFGLVSVEAQSYGVPVIAANVDGLPETLVPGRSGELVQPQIPVGSIPSQFQSEHGIPEFVVSPSNGKLTEPKALEIRDIYDAALKVIAHYECYSTAALEHATENYQFDSFIQSLSRALRV